MAQRSMSLTVSLSTNPATAHIGPFFLDVRDTSNNGNRQMMTGTGTARDLRDMIIKICRGAQAHNIMVAFQDHTADANFTGRGGLIGTPFSD